MKKMCLLGSLLFVFLLAPLQVSAQKDSVRISYEKGYGNNDVMINPIALVLGIGNISYERIISDDQGIGVSTIFQIDDYVTGGKPFFQLTPYYRYYLGRQRAGGFFIEGFMGLNTGKREIYNNTFDIKFSDNRSVEENYTNFGLGIGFGGKWVAKNNIIFEASFGLGRTLGAKDYDSKLFGKGMLGIGKRF